MRKILSLFLLVLFITGCAEVSPIKSPCDYSGNNCLPRIKVNSWDN